MSDVTRSACSTAAVTKSDTVDFTPKNGEYPRALYVGGAGDVAVVTPDGVVNTFSAVPAGTTLAVQCKRVNSTNTTATLILALY